MMTATETEEKANNLFLFPVLPAIVYVFGFIRFLLLHKSWLMTFTPRRTT